MGLKAGNGGHISNRKISTAKLFFYKTERKNDTVASKVVDAMKGLRGPMELLQSLIIDEMNGIKRRLNSLEQENRNFRRKIQKLECVPNRGESSDLSAPEQEEE